jgi:DNA replication initiation complex subunit (GINS family)
MPVAMAFKDEINYEIISQLNKKERKSSRLVDIDPEFYSAIITHLQKLHEEYNTKYLKSPTSTEALLLNNEICKLDNLLKEIYVRRERKVILAALDVNSTPDFKRMLKHEQQLYYSITKILNDYRDNILNGKPVPSCIETTKIEQPTLTDEVEPEAPEGPDVPEETEIEDFEPDETDAEESFEPNQIQVEEPVADTETTEPADKIKDEDEIEGDARTVEEPLELILVQVLEDIEPFLGSDMVTYNLSKEDIITLPKANAEILTKNNKIKIVEPNI